MALLACTAARAASTDAEAEWIRTAQLPDGAIAQYPDFTRINPYLANYAAMGLLRAWTKTGNTAYVDAAEAWFSWYESHMDANGYVTDYDLGPAPTYIETSTGDEDSTDGYAGTVLLALFQLRRQGKVGKLLLVDHHQLVTRAVDAIVSTQDADGLTWAKPTYLVKFLMDQSEAYAGLKVASRMAPLFHDPGLAKRARIAATAMSKGVATLWDGDLGLYRYAKLQDGSLQATTWGYYYPDAASEAWAVAVGNFLSPAHLVPSSRARQLMTTFTGTWPQWTEPGSTVEFNSGPHVVDYWPLIGGALVAVHRKAEGLSGTQAIESYAAANNRAYPFVVASAGQVVQVLDGP